MNKILLISAFLLLNLAANCQDTIFLKDGTIVLARILEETQESVRYKSWVNQDGPTWSKSMGNVAYIHYSKSMPAATTETLDFTACDGKTPAKGKKNCPTGNSVVAEIDRLYAGGNAEAAIGQYVRSLPSCIQRKCLYGYYLDRYHSNCTTGVAEHIIRDGEIYVYLGTNDENVPTTMTTLAKLYAREGDSINAKRWIDKLDKFSKGNDDMFSNDVESLRVLVDELLHPVPPEDAYKGVWVMIEDKLEWSPTIIKIDDVSDSAVAQYIESNVDNTEIRGDKMGYFTYQPLQQINTSQGIIFDGANSKGLIMQFASEDIVDLTSMQGAGQQMMNSINQAASNAIRQFQASNLSVGARTGAELGIGLGSSLLNLGIALATTYSSKEINSYMFSFTLPEDDILHGMMFHSYGKVRNDGNVKEKFDSSIVQFVRWEPSDNVVFASKDKRHKKPITCVPILSDDDPILAEFNSIQRKHTFWQPKYAIPEFVGTAACLGMFSGGVVCLANDNVAAGVPLLVTGLLGSFANLIVPATVAKHRRNNAFEAMNKRGYDILRDKAGWTPPVKEDKISIDEKTELEKAILTNLALKAEYDQILHRNRFGQAKYVVPLTVGTIAGAGMIAGGVVLMCDLKKTYSVGTYIGGFSLAGIGVYGAVASAIIPPIVCKHRRNKQLRELYHQHFDPKENAPEVGFSMLPCYTPENKGYGLSFNLNF